MKYLPILLLFVCSLRLFSQSCNATYTHTIYNENVVFNNQSSGSYLHYFWSFGDGTGSNVKDPIHEFVASGKYLVTLYVHDTINNSSDYVENWLTITKNSLDPCSPVIEDSIFTYNGGYYLKIKDFSNNCQSYSPQYRVGPASGPAYNIFGLGYYNGNFISTGYYYDNNSVCQKAVAKTSPNNFDRSKNYQPCSANFEFSVVSENTVEQRILFKAMRKNALRYEWIITGFGDPIYSNNDTISILYGGNPYSAFPTIAKNVILSVREQNGCRDSVWQQVSVRKKSSTYVGIHNQGISLLNVSIFPNPVRNKITLDFDPQALSLDRLSIINTLGQIRYVYEKPASGQEFNLEYLDSGIYYLKTESAGKQRVFKIFKE